MNTAQAFLMGEANRGREMRAFDWDKAARLILELHATEAVAGLSGDMEYTSGPILAGGIPVDEDETYTFLASTWAAPVIEIDGVEYECWRMEGAVPAEWLTDERDVSKTFWPESALNILFPDGRSRPKLSAPQE